MHKVFIVLTFSVFFNLGASHLHQALLSYKSMKGKNQHYYPGEVIRPTAKQQDNVPVPLIQKMGQHAHPNFFAGELASSYVKLIKEPSLNTVNETILFQEGFLPVANGSLETNHCRYEKAKQLKKEEAFEVLKNSPYRLSQLFLGKMYKQKGNYKEAQKLFQGCDHPEAKYLAAEIAFEKKDHKATVANLEDGLISFFHEPSTMPEGFLLRAYVHQPIVDFVRKNYSNKEYDETVQNLYTEGLEKIKEDQLACAIDLIAAAATAGSEKARCELLVQQLCNYKKPLLYKDLLQQEIQSLLKKEQDKTLKSDEHALLMMLRYWSFGSLIKKDENAQNLIEYILKPDNELVSPALFIKLYNPFDFFFKCWLNFEINKNDCEKICKFLVGTLDPQSKNYNKDYALLSAIFLQKFSAHKDIQNNSSQDVIKKWSHGYNSTLVYAINFFENLLVNFLGSDKEKAFKILDVLEEYVKAAQLQKRYRQIVTLKFFHFLNNEKTHEKALAYYKSFDAQAQFEMNKFVLSQFFSDSNEQKIKNFLVNATFDSSAASIELAFLSVLETFKRMHTNQRFIESLLQKVECLKNVDDSKLSFIQKLHKYYFITLNKEYEMFTLDESELNKLTDYEKGLYYVRARQDNVKALPCFEKAYKEGDIVAGFRFLLAWLKAGIKDNEKKEFFKDYFRLVNTKISFASFDQLDAYLGLFTLQKDYFTNPQKPEWFSGYALYCLDRFKEENKRLDEDTLYMILDVIMYGLVSYDYAPSVVQQNVKEVWKRLKALDQDDVKEQIGELYYKALNEKKDVFDEPYSVANYVTSIKEYLLPTTKSTIKKCNILLTIGKQYLASKKYADADDCFEQALNYVNDTVCSHKDEIIKIYQNEKKLKKKLDQQCKSNVKILEMAHIEAHEKRSDEPLKQQRGEMSVDLRKNFDSGYLHLSNYQCLLAHLGILKQDGLEIPECMENLVTPQWKSSFKFTTHALALIKLKKEYSQSKNFKQLKERLEHYKNFLSTQKGFDTKNIAYMCCKEVYSWVAELKTFESDQAFQKLLDDIEKVSYTLIKTLP